MSVGTPPRWAVTLAAVAQVTTTIRLGPMITPLPRRRPWKVAREAVTLDHLSRGRLVLGVVSYEVGIVTEHQPDIVLAEQRRT